MKVLVTPNVYEYLENLVITLYENGYFGFEDSARRYVDDLYCDIKTTLPIRPHRPAPKYFDRYGKRMKYTIFKVGKNKHTTWYAFFKTYKEDGEIIYVVRYIANNHSVAQYL